MASSARRGVLPNMVKNCSARSHWLVARGARFVKKKPCVCCRLPARPVKEIKIQYFARWGILLLLFFVSILPLPAPARAVFGICLCGVRGGGFWRPPRCRFGCLACLAPVFPTAACVFGLVSSSFDASSDPCRTNRATKDDCALYSQASLTVKVGNQLQKR